MNELMIINGVKTMDSREVARLTKKNHSNVCRDIHEQIGKLEGGEIRFESSYITLQNKKAICYKLPYRETMILISGYSVELRAKVIDRWLELEKEKNNGFKLPQTYSEALQLAADQAKELEKKNIQLQIAAPKVDFFNQVTSSKDAIEMKEAAKILNIKGMGRNNLFQFLREQKVLMDNNTPYQCFVDCGYFRVIEQKYEVDFEVHINLKTIVYQKGLDFIRRLINSKDLQKSLELDN